MRVVHLINGLGKGGAETMLYQVIKYRSANAPDYHVISLGESSFYEERIRADGIPVSVVQLRKSPLKALIELYNLLTDADVINCWLYHANLIGYILACLLAHKKLIWNIRHSELSPRWNKHSTLFINTVCARISKNVDCIAYNGMKARLAHESIGYAKEKAIVLDNGCDTDDYKFIPGARQKILNELGISASVQIVLSVSKDSSIKDWPTFVRAIAKCKQTNPYIVAVICGSGLTEDNQRFAQVCKSVNLTVGIDIFPLGLRHDVPVLLSAADLYVLHSVGEAFPNSLLQAMSSGCLCVTTDVGDAKRILNDDEYVAPAGDSELLAYKIGRILSNDDSKKYRIRKANRARVERLFNIEKIIEKYEQMYK